MNRVRPIAALFPRYGLVVSWLLSVVWMAFDYWHDPGNISQHGHNSPGVFEFTIKLGLIELCILYFILNPWVKKWKMERILLAIVLSWGWTVLLMLGLMHAGGIFIIHWLWLLAVDLGLFISLLVIGATKNH